MLREYNTGNDPSRRWFGDEYFDLIVWYRNGEPVEFQLCYDRGRNEHSLTWKKGGAVQHSRIDDGEEDPSRNMSPILVPDGAVPYQLLLQKFNERAVELEREVFTLVLRQLEEASRAAANRSA